MITNAMPHIVNTVDKLYGTSETPIRPNEILEKVCKKANIDSYGFPAEIITDALLDEPNYVEIFEKEEDSYFISRKAVFAKAQFLIKPSAFEIQEGILFSGHRFIPFFMPSDKIKICPEGSSKAFRTLSKKYDINDIIIYYSLLGPKGMLDILTAENEDNVFTFMNALNPEQQEKMQSLKISVYNMKDFFTQNQLTSNDMLLLSVVDHKKKLCEVKVIKQESLKERAWEKAEWLKLLSDSIKKSIDCVDATGEMEAIDTFLARAFYFGGKKLIENPPANIINLLGPDSDFELKSSPNGYALIWEKNRLFDLEDTFFDMLDNDDDDISNDFDAEDSDIELTPFDEYCEIMGFSFSQVEIEAYMKDELFSNPSKASFDNVVKRCFDERIDKHYPDLKEAFFADLNKTWKKISSDYNIFKDNLKGPLRNQVLSIIDQHHTWIRKLDKANVNITPKLQNALSELMQLMTPLYGMIGMLNKDEDMKKEEVKKFISMLDILKVTHKSHLDSLDIF